MATCAIRIGQNEFECTNADWNYACRVASSGTVVTSIGIMSLATGVIFSPRYFLFTEGTVKPQGDLIVVAIGKYVSVDHTTVSQYFALDRNR